MARNPEQNFPDMETWLQLFFYVETFDPINTLEKTKTKQVLFEGFRLLETLDSFQANEFLGEKLEFKGRTYLVSFDIIDGDKRFFIDKTRELYIAFNEDTMSNLEQNPNFNATAKLHRLPRFTGLHQNMCGMLETVWLEISN